MDDPFTNLTLRALRRILRAADRDTRLLATTTGLTPSQLGVLQEVGRHSALPPTSIASATGISPANVTAIVDRLLAKGLVMRQRGHVDRRQILVSLTDEGRILSDKAPEALQERFLAAFRALPEWERAMILASLERLGALMDVQDIDAAPLIDAGPIDREA